MFAPTKINFWELLIYFLNWVRAKPFSAFFTLTWVGSKYKNVHRLIKYAQWTKICSSQQFCTWSIIIFIIRFNAANTAKDEQFFLGVDHILSSSRLALDFIITRKWSLRKKKIVSTKTFEIKLFFELKKIQCTIFVVAVHDGCIQNSWDFSLFLSIFLIEKEETCKRY